MTRMIQRAKHEPMRRELLVLLVGVVSGMSWRKITGRVCCKLCGINGEEPYLM